MVLNWGGVGNVTYLGADGEIVAFDTGPANALIDDFVRRRRGLSHDEGGALAAAGRVDEAVLAGFDERSLFRRRRRPNRSTAIIFTRSRAKSKRSATKTARRRSPLSPSRRPPRRCAMSATSRRAGWSAAAAGAISH